MITSAPAPHPVWLTIAMFAIFAAAFAVLALRLHALQIEQHEALRARGERQRVRVISVPARRGGIFDASGAPLAVSQPSWTLLADPAYMDDRLRATLELERIIGVPRERLRAHFSAATNGRVIAHGLDEAQAQAIRELRLRGLRLRRDHARCWPSEPLAPHVVGFVNDDGRGGGGIEQTMHEWLAGRDGREVMEVDALGNPLVGISGERQEPEDGHHVQLTIEIPVQRALEAALAEAAEKHAPQGIAGIVVRAATGEIVAMASWPTFDPRDRSTFRPEALNNRAVQFTYEPGSTFKPLIAGAAVADGLARFDERIFCEHGRWTHRVGRAARTITDHSLASGGHGMLTVTEGIALSDNILMAKLGLRLGPQRLYEWVQQLQFGRRLGIPLPGEGPGIVRPRQAWNELGACMSVPMGHEIAVTPLQLIMAHAAIANRGMWMPPRLIKRVWREGASDAALPPPEAPRRVFREQDALQIEEAMTHTMSEGTARASDLEGYVAAGKTGTTMKIVDGRYSHEQHVGSFVGWAPAHREAPVQDKLVCLIALDDATKNGHFGAQVAAPYVQRVLQFALERAGVPKVEKPAPARRAR